MCLSVGAREHRGRSDTEVERVATTARISHLARDIYIYIYFRIYTPCINKQKELLKINLPLTIKEVDDLFFGSESTHAFKRCQCYSHLRLVIRIRIFVRFCCMKLLCMFLVEDSIFNASSNICAGLCCDQNYFKRNISEFQPCVPQDGDTHTYSRKASVSTPSVTIQVSKSVSKIQNLIGKELNQYTLFGWACIDRDLLTERTLKRKGSCPSVGN